MIVPLLPRGVRNNNPGNIDRATTQWFGMSASQLDDPRFIVFDKPEFGIRALTKILITYQQEGLHTVRAMINRWAPPIENNSTAYVNFVSGRMGISPDVNFDIHNPVLCQAMVAAIIAQENSNYAYPAQVLQHGVLMAGISLPVDEQHA